MGALPDHQPQHGAAHRRPEAAPPLRAVPGQRPTAAPAPPPAVPPPTPTAPARQADPAPGPEPDEAPQSDVDEAGLDLDQVAAVRTWVVTHLRPPDLVHQATPGLKTLWEQALQGDHLPAHPVLRVAEVARLVVSLPVIAAAVLLAWTCVSAARQAALALALVSLWVLVSALVSAVTALT